MANIYAYANPTTFMRLSGAVLPWAWAVAGGCLAIGLYLGLLTAPADYQQGDTVRIMFVHVPAAWMAMFTYTVMTLASITSIVFKHPIADVCGRAAAPIGAGFTLVALATGSLWGAPMWGTWWEWDARMTSVLILFFLYIGYIALWNAIDDPIRAGRAAAILCICGFVMVPIIKFSVDWWNTLHQPASVLRMGGPSMSAEFLRPLLVMALAFKAYFVAVLLVRMRAEVLGRRLRQFRLTEAAASDAGG